MEHIFKLRKERMKGKMAHRIIEILLSAVMIAGMLAMGGMTAYALEEKAAPTPVISKEGGTFSGDTLTLTIGLQNATSGTYKIGSAMAETYTQEKSITIGSGMEVGDSIKIVLTATDGEQTITKEYTFTKADPVVSVTVGDVISYYADIYEAWAAAQEAHNGDVIVTLLDDVEMESVLNIKINCTLDLGGHTIRNIGSDTCIGIYGGKNVIIQGEGEVISEQSHALVVLGSATLQGGTFTSNRENCAGVYVNSEGANLSVTGENVVIRNTGGGYGLAVNAVESVRLSSGKYSATAGAISIYPYNTIPPTIGGLLDQTGDIRYAYYKNGKPMTTGLDGSILKDGVYTVKECGHSYEYVHESGSTTHTKSCPACGKGWSEEFCSYDADGKCACGSTLAVTLPDGLNLTYNGREQKPDVTVTVDGQVVLGAENYNVVYTNNINASKDKAKVTVSSEGEGVYTFRKELNFTIATVVLTPAITGTTTKTYDGTNAAPADLSIILMGVIDNDDVTAAAGSYTYNSADAGEHTITAGDITLDGADAGNYELSATSIFTAGQITKADQDAPNPPSATDENIKDTSITLTAVKNAQYSMDGETWQDSPTFTGLSPDTAYTFRVRIKEDANHNASPGSTAASITTKKIMLNGATVTVDGSYTYTGAEIVPAAGNVTVKLGGRTVDSGQYTISVTNNVNAGTATVTVTATESGDYSGSVSGTFAIGKAMPDIGIVTAEPLSDTLDVSKVRLNRTNSTPAGTLTLEDNTLKYGANTYTWKFTPDDVVNYEQSTGKVQITVNDTIAPSAEYQIGTDSWKKFVNTISVSSFYKGQKTFAIRCTDDTDEAAGGGIALTQYYISDREIVDTGSITWSNYTEPFSLDEKGTWFIYVKVADNAGNTAVLNSEGIVVYEESIVSPEAFDYTCGENRDCTVQLTMNGNTFKNLMDNEGNVVGTDNYTIDGNGTIILKAAYLDTLDKGAYTYKVLMNPQGVETEQMTLTYTFTVNVAQKSGYVADDLNKSYLYLRENTDSIDLAVLLPKDCGAVSYGIPETSGNVIYSDAPAVNDGKLSFTLGIGTINDAGTIKVTVKTHNYEDITVTVNVKLIDQIPVSLKTGTEVALKNHVLTFGEALSKLEFYEAEFVDGDGKKVSGTLAWRDDAAIPDAGTKSAVWVFTPVDIMYASVQGMAAITVNKAQNAPNMPDSAMDVPKDIEKVGDVDLPDGWEWQASDKDTVLEGGETVNAAAIYAGEDKGNYENETVIIALTRLSCEHVAGEILYMGTGENAPTCTEEGLGHRECAKCGLVMQSGIVVEALGHTGGTASCSQRKVCTRCNQPYGDTDSSKHGDTEVRGVAAATCTAGGYTGDIYCKDCGAKMKTGKETPALGHDYTGKVTKEPTTDSEGIKTYICSHCGNQYTENIAKLPGNSNDKPEENSHAQVKSVKLSKTVFTYNGKAQKPSVIAVDTDGKQISGKYYTIKYKNNKKVGEATVMVTFKDGYSGTVEKTFTIRPAKTSIKKLRAVPCGFTIKWAKKSVQTSGYQIQYSTKAGFKGKSTRSIFVKKASATRTTVKKLKAGKKYYVRIRTYKKVKLRGKSTKIYSAWSSAKRVKTLPAALR